LTQRLTPVDVLGAKMRQQRHTTAYTPSWQASGNRAAPHRHSSEINAPDRKKPRPFSRGAPSLTLPPEPASASGQSHGRRVRYKPTANGRAGECPLPSPFVALGRHVLSSTAANLLFPARRRSGERPPKAGKGPRCREWTGPIEPRQSRCGYMVTCSRTQTLG
jgi:hypothetical protein